MSTNVDSSLLLRAATEAAGRQHFEAGALYVVATPIGNLADITLRAMHVLSCVDAVACEDTRVGGALLSHLGLRKPLLALHAHNEQGASAMVLERLARGEAVALVSDAGTPAVSDPGAIVVAAAAAAGHRVVPLPGPSSVLAALCAAGVVHGEGYRFVGFLPPKGAERLARLQALLAGGETLVLFEAPHRIEALARELANALADDVLADEPANAPEKDSAHGRAPRRVTLARELTKQFESITTMPVGALPAWLQADAHHRRGEFVIVLHAPEARRAGSEGDLPGAALKALAVLQRELPLKQAVALAAEITGAPRNALYAWALAQRDGAEG